MAKTGTEIVYMDNMLKSLERAEALRRAALRAAIEAVYGCHGRVLTVREFEKAEQAFNEVLIRRPKTD